MGKPAQDLRPCHGGKQPAKTPLSKKYGTPKSVGHIKMQFIDDFKASTIASKIKQDTDSNADVTTDGVSNYASLEKDRAVSLYQAVVMDDKKSVGKVLP